MIIISLNTAMGVNYKHYVIITARVVTNGSRLSMMEFGRQQPSPERAYYETHRTLPGIKRKMGRGGEREGERGGGGERENGYGYGG